MLSTLAATTRRFVRWEFVPEALLLIGLSAFFVDQTDAATSAFKSSKALAIMAAVTVGWLGARLAMARLLRFAPARTAVFSVATAVALAVVVFPAYDNETVIESFPAAAATGAEPPAAAPPTATDAVESVAGAPADERQTTPTTVPVVAPPTPRSTAAPPSTPTTATASAGPTPTAPAAPATPEPAPPAPQPEPTAAAPAPPEALPAGPQRLRSGPIRGIDHRASGTAVIYRQPDGHYVVGLEDIDIQPGPDYDLYIVPGENREDTKGGIRLGDLRGNKGTQFYEVPTGTDLENGPWTVLVWCQTFAVPVAGSTPT